jgi:hypothetical protein
MRTAFFLGGPVHGRELSRSDWPLWVRVALAPDGSADVVALPDDAGAEDRVGAYERTGYGYVCQGRASESSPIAFYDFQPGTDQTPSQAQPPSAPRRAPADGASYLPPGLVAAIEDRVLAAGGDEADMRDLADVWRRAIRVSDRRAGAIRTSVRLRRCRCADGGTPDGGRCGRCHRRAMPAQPELSEHRPRSVAGEG